MPKVRTGEQVWGQLATRIPKELHRRLRIHCVTTDIAQSDFITAAVEEHLARQRRRAQRSR
jgi:hypothetical protein